MAWRVFIDDWDGNTMGELDDMLDPNFGFSLGRQWTASLAIGTDNALAGECLVDPYDPSTYRLLRAYRLYPGESLDSVWETPTFVGPLITLDVTASRHDRPTLALGAIGAGHFAMAARIVPGSKSPQGYRVPGPIDAGQLADRILNEANDVGNTWIRVPGGPATAVRTGTTVLEPYSSVSAAMETLAGGGFGGFDYEMTPAFRHDDNGLVLADFNRSAVLGDDLRDSVIYEYATGRHNVSEISIRTSMEGLINRAYHYQQGLGAAVERDDPDARRQQGILLEATISAELTDPLLRRQLVDLHVAVRSRPRRIVTFTPEPQAAAHQPLPVPMRDVRPGDTIGLIANMQHPKLDLAAAMRVYDLSVATDSNGTETVTIGVIPEGGSS